jgi:hypothetical protein
MIADSTQGCYKVLGKVGSMFSLKRENPLPTSYHQEDDLTFNSHHQEWLSSNESIIAILLSSLKGKNTIECQKAFNKRDNQHPVGNGMNQPTTLKPCFFVLYPVNCRIRNKEPSSLLVAWVLPLTQI